MNFSKNNMGYDKLGDNIILIYTNISYITGVVFMILFYFEWVRELVSDCNFSYVMAWTTYIQRDHNCVRFYAYCWFYFNGSSLKENSPLVNIVASFERIILNPFLILLISNGCLALHTKNKNVPRSTILTLYTKMCLSPRFYTPIKLQKMHSILIITFKSHQNLI